MSDAFIMVAITEDAIPELDESFTVSLTSVELLESVEDTSTFPTLGSATAVEITIQASDDPFGSITISQSTYSVIEGSTLNISLVRMGGSLGVITVNYATVNGRAVSPDDYSSASGSLVFTQGQTAAEIFVPTVDDDEPEIVEDFGFGLLGVSGGSLGNITRATIFIAASDSPFGVVGFSLAVVSSGVSIANPTQSPRPVTLRVERMGGTVGSTDITWSITGPGLTGIPSSDIATNSLGGTLTLTGGQR